MRGVDSAMRGRTQISVGLALSAAALFLLVFHPSEASAENRLYHLRVTLRSGKRYETISMFDPVNYCRLNGGSVVYMRDYSLIYSPEIKVKVLRTWTDMRPDLAGRWRDVLRANNMLSNNNHKALARLEPLAISDMMRPE